MKKVEFLKGLARVVLFAMGMVFVAIGLPILAIATADISLHGFFFIVLGAAATVTGFSFMLFSVFQCSGSKGGNEEYQSK